MVAYFLFWEGYTRISNSFVQVLFKTNVRFLQKLFDLWLLFFSLSLDYYFFFK